MLDSRYYLWLRSIIEHYVRNLDKDKGTILRAPTAFRE